MASFRIHEDQENRVPEIRQKQINVMAPTQLKRTILGQLDNHIDRPLKNKQPLGISNIKANENLNKQNIQKLPPPVVPVAQFEAFKVGEDSKENDLEKKLEECQRRRKNRDPYAEIYKGTAEDKFITKKEWLEMEAKRKQELEQKRQLQIEAIRKQKEADAQSRKEEEEEKLKALHALKVASDKNLKSPIIESIDAGSPMSIEKSLTDDLQNENKLNREIIAKTSRDLFFEMPQYRTDIYLYLREHELRNRPKPGYMRKQPDITYNMRAILVDWLVEVAEEYRLQTETLYLAVNFIDRFLSYMSVVRTKLQLVGTAAMFIAAKYEEIIPPDVGEFVYITDDTYNKKQVIRMEHLILKVLSFDLSVPTPLTFITAICISNQLSKKVMYLAMYLSELSMLEADPYLENLPSVIAASAVALARHNLEMDPWTKELSTNTGFQLTDLKKTIDFLQEMFVKAPSLLQQGIQEKYKSSKYMHVSSLSPREPLSF
ncbi:cyclin-A2 [Agrilus planipennis]|uniref:Cyclin-A2 n=1 Tax=Agrilus planipennis TaxID=224129 RepID=A0A1W4X1G6_AGRPL|nr:cyclin-A2 [Agrilus planipennis]